MAAKYQLPPQFEIPEEQMTELRERIIRYRASMGMVNSMHKQGILDDQDYKEAEALMAEKYGLSDKSLYRYREPPKEE